jgi:hypothetical protein
VIAEAFITGLNGIVSGITLRFSQIRLDMEADRVAARQDVPKKHQTRKFGRRMSKAAAKPKERADYEARADKGEAFSASDNRANLCSSTTCNGTRTFVV